MSEATDKIKISKTDKDKAKTAKKHVDCAPTIHESRDASKINQLVLTLGESTNATALRHVLVDPVTAVQSAQYRETAGRLLERLLDVVFNDLTVFNKVRVDLPKHIDEGVIGDIIKDTAKDMADHLLHKHLGVIGKAISIRTIKKKKKKP